MWRGEVEGLERSQKQVRIKEFRLYSGNKRSTEDFVEGCDVIKSPLLGD